MFDKKQSGAEPKDDKDKTSLLEQEEAEEERKHGGHVKKRAHGGSLEARRKEREPRKHAGKTHEAPHHARKHGGSIPGKKSEHRPDRRARGGQAGSADLKPMSSAGNMSEMDYMCGKRTNRDEEDAGKGGDRNAKGFG